MEDEIRRQLIESQRAHKLRLRELERRAALLGMNVPPEVAIEIADLQKVVVDLNRQLGPTAPRTLPEPPTDFVGRAREVEQLVEQVDQALRHGNKAIVCVRGMGGVGKTALAYSAARHLEARFPDGQLLVDLRYMGDAATPAEALQLAIRAMSEATRLPDDPGELEGVYRTCLAGKRVLILADDAQDAAQVRPLTPPEGCALLITSRNRFTLPGMAPLDLDVLAPAAAETLLLTICPRIGDYAARLAGLCGQLPLALRMSAGLLACDGTRNVARYVAGLKVKRLNNLGDPDDPSASVEAALRLSYDMLEADQQWMLCQLDVFPASFDLAAAEAIVGGAGLEDLLGALHRRCLLAWDAAAERYDLHVLVRAFVRAQQPVHESMRLRHAQYYAELARRARRLLRQEGDSRRDGLALLDREWAHIDAGWAWAHQQDGHAVCAELLLAYTEATLAVVERYYGFDQRLMLLEQALRLASQNRHAAIQAPLLVKLGDTLMQLNDTAAHLQNMEQALTWYCEAATIARDYARPRDWWSECRAWIGMGVAQARKGEHLEAIWASMQ
ncbi:MAG: NB-ARC domain-containing protein, partial [Roseiflexaceae bacterium]